MIDVEQLVARLVPEHRRILEQIGRLAAERGEPAWLVGGSVRDLILERDNDDIDVVVEGDGMALAQAFSRARDGGLTRHHEFGTARVDLPEGGHVDFATARAESYARSGVLPKVSRGSLEQDLARRDFTINAIALGLPPDAEARIVDPFDGVGDIERGRVRFLHEGSFSDDPTRALRGVRFALRFGYEIEARTATALAAAARGGFLERISGDRLRRELQKLLGEAPVEGARALHENGLLAGIHAGLRFDEPLLERLIAGGGAGWTLVLAALAAEMETQARWELARRLRMSREQRAPLIEGGAPWERTVELVHDSGASELEKVEAVESLAAGTLRVGLARLTEAGLADRIRRLAESAAAARPHLDGDALRELGCPPGPEMGEMLRRLRAAHIAGSVHDADGERRLVRRWLEGEESGAGDSN